MGYRTVASHSAVQSATHVWHFTALHVLTKRSTLGQSIFRSAVAQAFRPTPIWNALSISRTRRGC